MASRKKKGVESVVSFHETEGRWGERETKEGMNERRRKEKDMNEKRREGKKRRERGREGREKGKDKQCQGTTQGNTIQQKKRNGTMGIYPIISSPKLELGVGLRVTYGSRAPRRCCP